ncbi:MAG: IS701 family transposase [Solirubrobacteraceae bacterium]
MTDFLDPAGVRRLESFFDRIGAVLGHHRRRESFAIYAMGLFGDGERKSIEPIATRACPDPDDADAAHQSLLHFASTAAWSDHAVRHEAADYALSAMTERELVEAWILDDTGFLKQGRHSVGVQRQYTGSAGKITNCQIGVSLSIATRTEHLPIDFELYLPRCWTDDPARRREAQIPDDVVFKTKPELALGMIRRALDDGVPRGAVLGDCAYGRSVQFRQSVREMGLHYALGVDPDTTVHVIRKGTSKVSADAVSVRDLAFRIHESGGFRRCTWRKGTREDLTARFALRRVVPCADDSEALWLLIEWRDGEPEPANYFLASMYVKTKKQLVRLVMQRWRTERVYEDLKGELGLDHFEGRRFRGWHHHVSVALCCYAFIVAERVRRFSPSARGADDPAPERRAA